MRTPPLLVLPLLLALCPPAAAGELDGARIGEDSRWRPSACDRPAAPEVGEIGGAAERNEAVRAFNAYAKELNAYLTCAVDEANGDLTAFREIVSESLEAEKTQLQAEAERIKTKIESGGSK